MADGNNPRVVLGNNNPPADALGAFTTHITDLRLEAGNWLDGSPIENQAQADEVSRLLDELRRARKDADAARAEEKKPHDDQAKAVQAKWKPLLDTADLAADGCKKALAPWLQKVEEQQRAAAEAARREAERQAEEARAALAAAAGNDIAAREEAEALVTQAKAAERAASKAEQERPQAHGGARATSLRTSYEPVLTNGVEAARHYWTAERDACEAFFLSLAQKDVRAGKRQIPGFEIREERHVV